MTTETVEQYIERSLRDAYFAKLIKLGYWCPDCKLEAFPLHEGEPGWCPFCGCNPKPVPT